MGIIILNFMLNTKTKILVYLKEIILQKKALDSKGFSKALFEIHQHSTL